MALPNGTTARVHVEHAMANVESAVDVAFERIRDPRRLRPDAREELRRSLAGAIGHIEGIRIWLDAGAPEKR